MIEIKTRQFFQPYKIWNCNDCCIDQTSMSFLLLTQLWFSVIQRTHCYFVRRLISNNFIDWMRTLHRHRQNATLLLCNTWGVPIPDQHNLHAWKRPHASDNCAVSGRKKSKTKRNWQMRMLKSFINIAHYIPNTLHRAVISFVSMLNFFFPDLGGISSFFLIVDLFTLKPIHRSCNLCRYIRLCS